MERERERETEEGFQQPMEMRENMMGRGVKGCSWSIKWPVGGNINCKASLASLTIQYEQFK